MNEGDHDTIIVHTATHLLYILVLPPSLEKKRKTRVEACFIVDMKGFFFGLPDP